MPAYLLTFLIGVGLAVAARYLNKLLDVAEPKILAGTPRMIRRLRQHASANRSTWLAVSFVAALVTVSLMFGNVNAAVSSVLGFVAGWSTRFLGRFRGMGYAALLIGFASWVLTQNSLRDDAWGISLVAIAVAGGVIELLALVPGKPGSLARRVL